MHLRKAQDPNASGSQPADLPYQQSTPLDPSSSKQDEEVQNLCREILMVRIAEEFEAIPRSVSTSTTTILMISMSTFPTTWKLLLLKSQKPKSLPRRIYLLLLLLQW